MSILTYQSKSKLKKILRAVLIVLGVLALLAVFRFIYLERFLVYDKDGAHLDYGAALPETEKRTDSAQTETFALIREEAAAEATPADGSPAPLSGIYVTAGQLLEPDLAPILEAADGVNAVMLDMKTQTGKYLYTTAQAGTDTVSADLDAIGVVISALSRKPGMTLIARIPAFPDSAYALADYSRALTIRGGALWMDQNGSYCLDPASKDVQSYLAATAEELIRLGFDEVVFDGFAFPESGNIVYSGDRAQVVREAAQAVAGWLSASEIPVSFVSTDPEVYRFSHRMWIPEAAGELVSEQVRQYSEVFPDPGRLVFLTGSRDTRFASYSVMSPYLPAE